MKITKSFLVLAVVLGASSLQVAQAETLSQALKKCGQVQNSLKRLVCYDQIVNDMNRYGGLDDLMNVPAPLAAAGAPSPSRQTNQAASAPQSTAQTPAASQPAQRNADFGLEQRKLLEDTDQKIYASVTKIVKDPYKKRIFTLDNGHVWKETEVGSLRIKVNEVVYIERGSLGSFHMSRDDIKRRLRVKRVK